MFTPAATTTSISQMAETKADHGINSSCCSYNLKNHSICGYKAGKCRRKKPNKIKHDQLALTGDEVTSQSTDLGYDESLSSSCSSQSSSPITPKVKANSNASKLLRPSRVPFKDATFGIRSKPTVEIPREEVLVHSERILRSAQMRLNRSHIEEYYKLKTSQDDNNSCSVLLVNHGDLTLDSTIGNGSYNVVYSVKSIRSPDYTRQLDPEKIVVKTLRSKLLNDLPMLSACAADLRKEGLLLALLQHQEDGESENEPCCGSKHILNVLGWTTAGLSAFANGCHDSYFIILEKLDRTLLHSIEEWRALETLWQGHENSFRRKSVIGFRSDWLQAIQHPFFRKQQREYPYAEDRNVKDNWTKAFQNPTLHEIQFWNLRLGLLIDLCKAVSFLHSRRVIHRDLKPDNIGFDRSGTLKVFDFDVSRILPPRSAHDSLFRLTKKVGSPRYMSPEVARGESYNEKADVYAIALIAYELLSLKRPFESVTNKNSSSRFLGRRRWARGSRHSHFHDCVEVMSNYEPCVDKPKLTRFHELVKNLSRRDHKTTDDLGSLFRRKKIKRSSADANRNKRNRKKRSHVAKEKPKYANIRPLLPVATPSEFAKLSSSPMMEVNTKLLPQTSDIAMRTKHSINNVDFQTSSFFWTQSLRTIIDKAWSYDIPTRPSAQSLMGGLEAELQRIHESGFY